MSESLLLSAARVMTFHQQQYLTNASGFYFERDERLFLVTSRHVVIDEPTQHLPDRLEIEVHINAENLAESTEFSVPLYKDGQRIWRDAVDAGGEIDVAAIELDREALPETAVYCAFNESNLYGPSDVIEIGSPLLVVGFPLGFHDTLHHMPVARQAICASEFGLRFQGHGYFLTDARTHRGGSGAPVVMRREKRDVENDLPWLLLGVHSARIDMGTRDLMLDEALGLNCAWYADVLLRLTEPIESNEEAESPLA